ncbi:MAG: glycosyltransferase [Gammaproteobacteria bacterium]|nr:glycosyltransferase family 2 protein [Gammaproteobacteria bacterium]NNM01668.1 glycosyltransferase [Gammaproteobacteria bacterium]
MADKLYIAIATCGRSALLERTLRNIAECTKPDSYVATYVVENGRRDGIDEAVEAFPAEHGFRYLFHPQGNKSAALNRMLQEVNDGLIVFTDDDVRMNADFLQRYDGAVRGAGAGRFLGGRTSVDYEAEPDPWLKEFLPRSAVGWDLGDSERDIVEGEYFMGFNWAASAADLHALGGFNEEVGPGAAGGSTGQETDMQRRLMQAGVTGHYLPGAMVWHYIPTSRCTPAWILRRAYRRGIEKGRKRDMHDSVPTLMRVPRWMIVDTARKATGALLGQLRGSQREKFIRLFDLYFQCGELAGIRQRPAG